MAGFQEKLEQHSFQEVMKHKNRMCKQYWTESSCRGCPIAEEVHGYEGCCLIHFDPKRYEELVLQWAAEHPEPQYQTWKEWLEEQRVVVHFDSVNNKGIKVKWELTNMSNCPIPADIAQKLGLKPKEG